MRSSLAPPILTLACYGDSITRDEAIADPEQAVQRALAWLQSP